MRRFFGILEDKGATSIEYALIVTLIAVAIIASLRSVNTGVTSTYEKVQTAVDDAAQ